MPEIAIIIVVSLILFLMLKNFPNTKDDSISQRKRKNSLMKKILGRMFAGLRRKKEEEIKKAISADQDKIISPKEISDAQKSYWTDDAEIAKILFEADKAIDEGDYSRAEKRALEAITKNKKCDQAYVFISNVAVYKKNYEEAIESAKAALKCNRENASAYAVLGECYFYKERYFDSIESYHKAVSIDRNQPVWQAGLGKAYLEVRQYSKAAKALKRASSLDIDNKEYKELASLAEDKQRVHSNVFRR